MPHSLVGPFMFIYTMYYIPNTIDYTTTCHLLFTICYVPLRSLLGPSLQATASALRALRGYVGYAITRCMAVFIKFILGGCPCNTIPTIWCLD